MGTSEPNLVLYRRILQRQRLVNVSLLFLRILFGQIYVIASLRVCVPRGCGPFRLGPLIFNGKNYSALLAQDSCTYMQLLPLFWPEGRRHFFRVKPVLFCTWKICHKASFFPHNVKLTLEIRCLQRSSRYVISVSHSHRKKARRYEFRPRVKGRKNDKIRHDKKETNWIFWRFYKK